MRVVQVGVEDLDEGLASVRSDGGWTLRASRAAQLVAYLFGEGQGLAQSLADDGKVLGHFLVRHPVTLTSFVVGHLDSAGKRRVGDSSHAAPGELLRGMMISTVDSCLARSTELGAGVGARTYQAAGGSNPRSR